MAVFRIDYRGSVRGVTPTPQGGIRVDAGIRREGILEYPQPDGSVIREYVPLEELTRADSLSTLASAPVTNRHPPGMVNRKNFKQFAVGHVGTPRVDDSQVAADLVIQADDALTAVETKTRREVSAGYTCELDESPGIIQATGERYDRIQRNIRYNHVALVEAGRAGSSVALRMDSDGNVICEESQEMDPKEFAKLQVELAAAQAKLTAESARADAAEAASKTEKARADKAEGSLAVATARADAAEKLVTERQDADELARVSAVASKLVKGFKADGKTAAQIKSEVVSAKFPTLKLDAKDSADRLDGMFEAAAAQAPQSDVAQVRAAVKTPREDAKPVVRHDSDAARKKMVEDSRNAYKSAQAKN